MPLPARLLGLFAFGAVLGSAINLAICRLRYQPTTISPWSRRDGRTPPRQWADRWPLIGWIYLRRETAIHGHGFWIRPMLIELAMGIGLAWLYVWEVADHRLITGQLANILSADQIAALVLPTTDAHWQFLSHVLLIALMAVASFIDFDEKIIPDEVTVPGTIVGLVMAAVLPWSLLPHVGGWIVPPFFSNALQFAPGAAVPAAANGVYIQFLTLASPLDWPASLAGAPALTGLVLGLGCYWFWCFAILPRRRRVWYARHGIRQACRLLAAQVRYSFRATYIRALIPLGTLATIITWRLGGVHWAGLLTALMGLAGGGAMVWAIRVIGSVTLRKEAMGFGDVTLMMMVGTFVGWQAGVVIFFVAPFAALVIGILQLVLHRDDVIPYGPFLCLGTLAVVVDWPVFWSPGLQALFSVGWLMPVVLLASFALLGIMLTIWRQIKRVLFGRHDVQDEEK
ncbi:MAG: prepilin peptidase [Planctomycetes bacterium]|nr:prepilin peptidase [Planctomycetota bacterium]